MVDKHNDTVCPKCGYNEHLDDATYCQNCGIELYNYCTNTNCVANENDERINNAIVENALYCPYCGSESTFFDYLTADTHKMGNN